MKPQVENINKQTVQHILENDNNVDNELTKTKIQQLKDEFMKQQIKKQLKTIMNSGDYYKNDLP